MIPVDMNHFLILNVRCSFTFDPDNFPDPKGYIAQIKQKFGVKVCVWSKSTILLGTGTFADSFQSILIFRNCLPFSRRVFKEAISSKGKMGHPGSEFGPNLRGL